MTVAVCHKCGVMKHGAWTPCPACRYHPDTPEEQARAVILSDHIFSREDLQSISERIKRGEPVTFPEDQVQAFAQSIVTEGPQAKRDVRRCMLGCFLVAVAVILSITFLVGWLNRVG